MAIKKAKTKGKAKKTLRGGSRKKAAKKNT